ncbi:MAG: hypothetical protein UT26_C0045G0001, partial [Microgenomates group bacterium GW2011_GWC1_39_12]
VVILEVPMSIPVTILSRAIVKIEQPAY